MLGNMGGMRCVEQWAGGLLHPRHTIRLSGGSGRSVDPEVPSI
jgi:hypothetical protein